MAHELDKLLETAKRKTPSKEQREEQRRSFAYGNTAIENDLITRDMINAEADLLDQEEHERSAKPA